MKHLLSLALMLASVVACAQSNEVPENLVGVKEVVAQIDSAVTAMYGWEPADSTYTPVTDALVASILDQLSDPPKQSDGTVRQAAYDQARITWAEFKRLVEADAYEKALNFYLSEDEKGKKAGDFLLFLKHSSQRYTFFSQVLRPLTVEYKDKPVEEIFEEPQITTESAESLISEIQMKKMPGGTYEVPCTINGLPLKFIFDTGASDVTLSSVEANFMLKNDYLSEKDFKGSRRYLTAGGSIANGAIVRIKEVKVGDCILKNIEASVIKNQKAPLLLGQSVLDRFGSITIDNQNNKLIIKH